MYAPKPDKIIEIDRTKTLFDAGQVVIIAAGGGGIPVLEQMVAYRASAVIEKT